MSDPTKTKALMHHWDKEVCLAHAEKVGNVAFIRDGRFFTCSRSYVSDCINAGQEIEVLADHEAD